MLLNLEHYTCHCFIRKRCQCMLCLFYTVFCLSHNRNFQAGLHKTKKPLALQRQARRRHTAADIQPRHWSNNTSHARVVFMRAAMATRAITRLRILVANSANSGRVVDPRPSPRCGSAFCAYELLNSPLVVRNFSVLSFLTDQSLYLCRSPFQHVLRTSTRSRTPKEMGEG